MEINRHIKKYGSWADERSEIASGDLKKPYVAYIEEDDVIDWDTQSAAKDYSKEYFTIVVDQPGTFSLDGSYDIEYSLDGTNWQAMTSGSLPITGDFFPRKIHLRRNNEAGCELGINYSHPFDVEGNIMSLLYGEAFEGKTEFKPGTDSIFNALFINSRVRSAGNLVLPAITLVDGCYDAMFSDCHSLTTAPALPATTLVGSCYFRMFSDCHSLTTAPALPATTLAESCYEYMFSGCTSLTSAPALPATTLARRCYAAMFAQCTALANITCLAETLAAGSTVNWLQGVSTTGTFVKKAGVTWPTGVSGIPTGWTVEEV